MAEAYHTRAVEAHRGHGKLDVRLPEVADWCSRRGRAAAGDGASRPGATGEDQAGERRGLRLTP